MALAEGAESSAIRVGRQRLTFERQLDFVLQWWKAMYSQQVQDALELLLSHCHNSELKFLSTVCNRRMHIYQIDNWVKELLVIIANLIMIEPGAGTHLPP
jgi:hypothetical protein